MKAPVPCRVGKRAAQAVRSGHPWIFREALGQSFPDGQWLELRDPGGQGLGYGIYQAEGGIAVRMLGEELPGSDWLSRTLRRAMRHRSSLLRETEAYRLLNGENDGVPGVVIDVYQGVAVLQTYTAGVDALGRWAARQACHQYHLSSALWKFPTRRSDARAQGVRPLRGQPPRLVTFREGSLELWADLWGGQKSGTFLDLRGLRRWLAGQDLRGARVLNLFAYTGTAGLACCAAGAQEVVNVDAAQPSLDFGQQHHAHPAQRWRCADIFAQAGDLGQGYQLMVVDPPSMASRQDQVPKALAIYRRLYRTLAASLAPGGRMVACCCTSRISSAQLERTVGEALPGHKLLLSLAPETDHRARFPEARYLKVTVWGEKPGASRPGPAGT